MILPPAFTGDDSTINVIIETPMGSRNKFDYDPEYGLFRLGKILPGGTHFPMHFGFIPHTLGEDGDPLDALVMMEFPSYPGCWIECRLIGVMEAEQTEKDGKTIRNDRFLAIPSAAKELSEIRSAKELNEVLIKNLTSFFSYYNFMEGKKFKLLRIKGPSSAEKVIKEQLK